MKSGKRLITVLLIFTSATLLYGTWAAQRAHRNLVTLNVRDMEVRKVIGKIEWQTWESIFVNKEVQGKVTLNVRNLPLDEVLRLVGGQTSSRASVLYPLYSKKTSLTALQQALRGEVDASTHGWTNLQSRFAGRGAMGGPPRGAETNSSTQQVSLSLNGKDLQFATLAFQRLANARVVVEDGAASTVNMAVTKATVSRAVSRLAEKVHLNWTRVYALQSGAGSFRLRPSGPRPEFAAGETNRTLRFARGEEFRKTNESIEAQLAQSLPAEERKKFELAQAEREQRMQEMASLTPEQRRERGQMSGPAIDKMNRDRILNSTPEQRAHGFRR